MLPDRVSKPGPLTYESGALPNMNITDDAKQLCTHALALNDELMMMEVSQYEKKKKKIKTHAKTDTVPYKLRLCPYINLYNIK